MSRNLDSPTKLTEFAPLQNEEKQQTVGQFFSNLFSFKKSTPSEDASPAGPSSDTNSVSPETILQESISRRGTENKEYNENEGRNLPNVLKRILAVKSNNLQDYEDTHLKSYWMPDSVSKECYECSQKFTTFRRRHHCRVCGQIFCYDCCKESISGKILGCTGDLRVCMYCFKIVLSYLSSDMGKDLNADLKILQENLQQKFGSTPGSPNASTQDTASNLESPDSCNKPLRKISVGYQEEMFGVTGSMPNISYLSSEEKVRAFQNSSSLRSLFRELTRPNTGVTLGTHRYRLRNYTDCFFGSELVDWLICQQKAGTRIQGAALCQALLEGGYIECVSEPTSFVDGSVLYKPGEIATMEILPGSMFDINAHEEPSWVQQIQDSATDSETEITGPQHLHTNISKSNSYLLDINLEANSAYLSRSPNDRCPTTPDSTLGEESGISNEQKLEIRTSEQREFVPESGWHKASQLREENSEKLCYNLLTESHEQHEQSLLKQMLSSHGLSLNWLDIILPLVHQIVDVIRPDKQHNATNLDIRHYVQIKKLPGGLKTETKLVDGIVCSKNVAHKGMAVDVTNPKILLLQCSIVYQRTEGRLMSLEPILMQETEFLKHVSARIITLQPDIVLVKKNVSRLAQDFLRESGITLVHNVKQTILERLSICLDADLVPAVNAHIGNPQLGTCNRFYLKTYKTDKGLKTLMFFEGHPKNHLGCTVLLRGASNYELEKIKKVMSLMLLATYNWRLEKSFLMDEFAQPPCSKLEFLDDSKENSPTTPKNTFITKSEIPPKRNSEDSKNIPKKIDNNSAADKNPTLQQIDDFTDPLHSSYAEPTSDSEKITLSEVALANNFKKALDDTILCVSPYLRLTVPYLETEAGKKCKLRDFFPQELYYSEQFENHVRSKSQVREIHLEIVEKEEKKPLHPFLTSKITTSMETNEMQGLLAHFRACGGQYEKRDLICTNNNKQNDELRKKLRNATDQNKTDVLDLCNHQRLAVLYCSFSNESNNAPAFCVNPWVVHMDFYGRNDIPLGCFLEKYCFRASYQCPSFMQCTTPMSKHIRRFVHNSGCISITLDNISEQHADQIVMWSSCSKCNGVSPEVPMSTDTWSYSFAKYLELKFHCGVYTRRGNETCCHSLHHEHYQYFLFRNVVATFKYSPVNIWEISLPPSLINIAMNSQKLSDKLIDEIKDLAQKGHDIYSLISEKLACISGEPDLQANYKQLLVKEQTQFKMKIEEVQIKLTSPTIEVKDFDSSDVYPSYWRIADSLIKIKKFIVETVDQWNTRLSEAMKKKDSDKKKDKNVHSDLDSPSTDSKLLESAVFENTPQLDIVKKIRTSEEDQDSTSQNPPPSPKHSQRLQSDSSSQSHDETVESKKDPDKKKVKSLLLNLLPSSAPLYLIPCPFNSQEHYSLPCGVFASIVVSENDLSSIIAYTLNSQDYKRALEESKRFSEQSPSPLSKRKLQSEKEKLENSDEKNSGLLGFLRNKDSKTDLNGPALTSALQEPVSKSPNNQNLDSVDDAKKSKKIHFDVVFEDANCNFFCRIYFAEKFAALRSNVIPTGEETYIRSLAKSIQWNARGGKSGSKFTKTTDDRFVLKETNNTEIQLFLQFAPNYFSYMQTCYSSSQPTLLGKIVGIYEIILKNNISGQQGRRKHIVVMENLFYNRTVAQKFDLKGSLRNRLVVPDNQAQEGEIVLLDENLLKQSCNSPLYILPHSKAVLTAAIQNDTKFLSSQSVMDYSLLVGLDTENKELVLGIIDYIRTFTWDKRLETMVKKSGILGGQGKQPTIISPNEYQARFIAAMHKYFLEVPDHWAGLGKDMEL